MKTWIIFITCSFIVSVRCTSVCRPDSFLSGGDCTRCPSTCNKCTSLDYCSICKDTYYGTSCNKTCQLSCSICHKVYGYCKNGCPDGTFGSAESPECYYCPNTCRLCSSASLCFECKPDFYGPRCQPCPDTCEECDKTTGLCSRCKAGYFNQGGTCAKCSDGCRICDNGSACYTHVCQHGYLDPYAGQCVEECPNDTTSQTIISKKGQRCGLPTPSTCTMISSQQPYTCLTKKHCLRVCSPGKECPLSTANGNHNCSKMMLRKCRFDCQPPAHSKTNGMPPGESDHVCIEKCIVEVIADNSFTTECFYGNSPVSGSVITGGLTTVLCFQEHTKRQPDGEDTEGPTWVVHIVLLSVLMPMLLLNVVTCVLLHRRFGCCRRQRSHTAKKQRSAQPSDGYLTVVEKRRKTNDSSIEMTSFSGRHLPSQRPLEVERQQECRSQITRTTNAPENVQSYLPYEEYTAFISRPGDSNYETLQQSTDYPTSSGAASGTSADCEVIRQTSDTSVSIGAAWNTSGASVLRQSTRQTTTDGVKLDTDPNCETETMDDYLTAI